MRCIGVTCCVLLLACCWLERVDTMPTSTEEHLDCPSWTLRKPIYPLRDADELSSDCLHLLVEKMLAQDYPVHSILRVALQYHNKAMKYYLPPREKRTVTCNRQIVECCNDNDLCRLNFQESVRKTLINVMKKIQAKYPKVES